MNVSLTKELEDLVAAKVKTGRYLSASEVVREALRLLEERDRLKEMRLAGLRKEVQKGLQDLDSGNTVDGEEVFTKLRAKNAARRRKA
ncbi:MAG: CopG family transcriptional regulator [Polyangiaceae bacterium UTPRO1]|jgi:antitoxin ParD1/3/4|nr:type II toxin-antitoxin system ParD family antitoxin [Myxococcales bacterium]OQY66573.1 MAG: CopG family transcriptional regulator [Polyangiaceae bacterium UTPRO1]